MKNKLFLSLALLIAANLFITTPALAYTWSDAKRHAAATGTAILATGKATAGIALLGAAAALPVVTYQTLTNPDNNVTSIKLDVNFGMSAWVERNTTGFGYRKWPELIGPKNIRFSDVEILPSIPAICALVAATSITTGVIGCVLLKSAWNDFKSISFKSNEERIRNSGTNK
jgi:hypothetical protein